MADSRAGMEKEQDENLMCLLGQKIWKHSDVMGIGQRDIGTPIGQIRDTFETNRIDHQNK